jgi:hypothetical protein
MLITLSLGHFVETSLKQTVKDVATGRKMETGPLNF